MLLLCKNPHCPRHGKRFKAERASRRFCCDACKMATHRSGKHKPVGRTIWVDMKALDTREPRFSTAPSRVKNFDGTPALSLGELAAKLLEIAHEDDNGKPKTGRRYYYLALSHGYIKPDMRDTPEAKKSREAAYDRVTD